MEFKTIISINLIMFYAFFILFGIFSCFYGLFSRAKDKLKKKATELEIKENKIKHKLKFAQAIAIQTLMERACLQGTISGDVLFLLRNLENRRIVNHKSYHSIKYAYDDIKYYWNIELIFEKVKENPKLHIGESLSLEFSKMKHVGY